LFVLYVWYMFGYFWYMFVIFCVRFYYIFIYVLYVLLILLFSLLFVISYCFLLVISNVLNQTLLLVTIICHYLLLVICEP